MSDQKDSEDGADGLSPDIMYDQTGDESSKGHDKNSKAFTGPPETESESEPELETASGKGSDGGNSGGDEPPAKKPNRLNPFLRWALYVIAGFFLFSVLSVALHRFVPVPITILMVQRLFEGEGLDHRWVSAQRISPHLKAAVIAAEDAKFCTHAGFDIEAIEKAQKHNARSKKKRGASTISQQTAKNVFLWPSRSWVRKGFEVYYTGLIELMWPKERILEVYLNSVEWGPGVYGAESASRYWFGKSADDLTRNEAARLAAILPSPRKWKAAKSGKYVQKRSGMIQARARIADDICAEE